LHHILFLLFLFFLSIPEGRGLEGDTAGNRLLPTAMHVQGHELRKSLCVHHMHKEAQVAHSVGFLLMQPLFVQGRGVMGQGALLTPPPSLKWSTIAPEPRNAEILLEQTNRKCVSRPRCSNPLCYGPY
jgi:hypothetical protein